LFTPVPPLAEVKGIASEPTVEPFPVKIPVKEVGVVTPIEEIPPPEGVLH
jgi:hypothetical protein